MVHAILFGSSENNDSRIHTSYNMTSTLVRPLVFNTYQFFFIYKLALDICEWVLFVQR